MIVKSISIKDIPEKRGNILSACIVSQPQWYHGERLNENKIHAVKDKDTWYPAENMYETFFFRQRNLTLHETGFSFHVTYSRVFKGKWEVKFHCLILLEQLKIMPNKNQIHLLNINGSSDFITVFNHDCCSPCRADCVCTSWCR